MTQTRILLAMNHHLLRECMANSLSSRIDDLVIDLADGPLAGIERCKQADYRLVVLDADPPSPLTPAMTRLFTTRHPETDVLVVGSGREEEEIVAFLEAGARDFRISDTESLEAFCDAIQDALRGEIHYHPQRTRALFSRLQVLSAEVARIKSIDTMVLTNREMDILRHLDEGKSNKQIAQELHLSLHTIKNHVHRILEKLKVTNRREAVHRAYNNGWLKVQAG